MFKNCVLIFSQTHQKNCVNLVVPNEDTRFLENIYDYPGGGTKDVLGKKCTSTDPLSDFYPIRFLN